MPKAKSSEIGQSTCQFLKQPWPMRKKASAFRLPVALLLALLAQGCASEATRQSESFGTATMDALVVMSVRATRDLSLNYVMRWWAVDPATGSLKKYDPLAKQRVWFDAGRSEREGSGYTTSAYFVLRTAPGEYVLESIRSGHQGVEKTKKFRPRALAFRVRAGEIVYLGDFTFNAPTGTALFSEIDFTAIRVEWTGRDDGAAQSAVDRHNGIAGKIRFVKPTVRELPR